MNRKKISLTVNQREITMEVDVRESLLDLLRNDLHLTGSKKACGVGECGACTVLIDGVPFDSCIYLAVWADGKNISTIEGEASDGELSKVQRSFLEKNAVQCGFCTPGLVMSTTAMLKSGHKFTPEEIKRGLSGHMCRCTGYQNIYKAAQRALSEE